MKIIKLQAENVKRLHAVEIEPDGSLVVIGGQNGQGKSSVLDSIMYALGGTSTVCSEPIHQGEKKASVEIDLGEFKVTRRFTANGSSLKVVAADGVEMKSPQAVLDKLHGSLAFDPLGFASMKPADQLQTLKTLVGVDTKLVDTRIESVRANRTLVNRDLKAAEARLSAARFTPGAPESEVSSAALVQQIEHLRSAEIRANASREHVNAMEIQLANARNALDAAQRQYDAAATGLKVAEGLVDKPALDAARASLANADSVNRTVRANAEYTRIKGEAKALQVASDEASSEIERLESEREKMIAAARFPIGGLSLGPSGVMFDGKPFEQASSAEQLRVSIAMAIAMNPKLRVCLIRDGSLLDADSLALVAEMAEKHDFQIWMERVGEGEECSVIIEDGYVAFSETDPELP